MRRRIFPTRTCASRCRRHDRSDHVSAQMPHLCLLKCPICVWSGALYGHAQVIHLCVLRGCIYPSTFGVLRRTVASEYPGHLN